MLVIKNEEKKNIFHATILKTTLIPDYKENLINSSTYCLPLRNDEKTMLCDSIVLIFIFTSLENTTLKLPYLTDRKLFNKTIQ